LTLGSYAYRRGAWEVNAQPHVVLKLKRVFPRVSRRQHGAIRLTDTAEVARDLEWFISRYRLDPADAESEARLADGAGKHRDQQALVDQLLAGLQAPRAFDLAVPPREYQRVAANVCLAAGGLLLADDVGLGKTCAAICVISHADARPALVVTLTHLPRQWEGEIQRFAPGLSTHILRSGRPYDLRVARRARPGQQVLGGAPVPDVIIANYHKLDGWAETLAPIVKTVVFDEAQELRHRGSLKSSAAVHLAERCRYRLACTATPIYNYGDEIFNVIDAVRPGAMGSRAEFLQEWCTSPDARGRARVQDPAAFGTYARAGGLMLRRTRQDVGRELPALTRIPHHIDCDPERLEAVESAATELARVILAQNETARGEKFRAAEELSGLVRQATGIAKAPYVAEFVRILVTNGEKVVLYGWHREVYSIWLERLRDLKPALYTGSESPTQKQQSFDRFAAGDTPVLIMSLRAGAGLDGLQAHARTIVFGELDWSPGVHEQCCGRVHRDGQADPVVAYYLITASGSDPIVADVLGVKAAQAAGIRDPDAPLVEKLQADGDHIRRLAAAYLSRQESPA
jgi:SNF2 family DNA or RNA helicase